MNYLEAINYIEEKNKLGSVLGLDSIKELLKRLGNPQESLKVIHIAGTNGKGSILAYIDSTLRQVGANVGRYISPTIFTYLERFQINGVYMTPEEFSHYLYRVSQSIATMEKEGLSSPTAFEIETAISFLYFLDKKVDYVLLETGMGGRLDATNVVMAPICTIIASVSMDHMNFLGNTIERIAYEKAGIIKENVPCVIYPGKREGIKIIEEVCEKQNVSMIYAKEDKVTILKDELDNIIFNYKNKEYAIAMSGYHQVLNAITAIETLKIIGGQDNRLDYEAIRAGLKNAIWPGRFEVLRKHPYVIRDGAHNEDAARVLRATIEKHFTNMRIVYIIGMLRDKEYDKVLDITMPFAHSVYTITTKGPRALESSVLANKAREYTDLVYDKGEEDINKVLWEAMGEASKQGVVIVFGSLSYIGNISC